MTVSHRLLLVSLADVKEGVLTEIHGKVHGVSLESRSSHCDVAAVYRSVGKETD
jgi:hypothetical protein